MRAQPTEIARHVAAIAAEMSARALAILDAGVRWVTPGDLNASFEKTDNKSRSHWELSAPILARIFRDHGKEGVDVLVDRHGGRMRYGPLLEETFPRARVSVLLEERTVSEYTVAQGEGDGKMRMRVAFAERAEGASLAVALASCLAKYAREVSMRAFNDYFGSLQPGLKPTAGYFSDGWRWLEEAAPAIALSGLHRSRLVRAR
jgi:ribonuclease HIII